MNQLVKISKLSKSFGNFSAVSNISFDLQKGEVLGFLGPNGAGKTTTMRMLTGFLKPTEGEIYINNVNLQKNPVLCRKYIGYVPEGSPLYNEMNTIDFLKFIADVRNIGKDCVEEALNKVIRLLSLNSILFQKIDTLSKGYKRRIGLAQSIIHNPDVLILDEPTDGLDPNQKNEVRKLIKKLGKEKAIIISTHILEEVNAICNRAMIIANGKLLLDEKPKDILKKSDNFNSIFISVEEMKSEELKKNILDLKISDNVKIINNYCVIKIDRSKSFKKKLDTYIKHKNLTLKHYSMGQGSLEEVFRRLTTNEK